MKNLLDNILLLPVALAVERSRVIDFVFAVVIVLAFPLGFMREYRRRRRGC